MWTPLAIPKLPDQALGRSGGCKYTMGRSVAGARGRGSNRGRGGRGTRSAASLYPPPTPTSARYPTLPAPNDRFRRINDDDPARGADAAVGGESGAAVSPSNLAPTPRKRSRGVTTPGACHCCKISVAARKQFANAILRSLRALPAAPTLALQIATSGQQLEPPAGYGQYATMRFSVIRHVAHVLWGLGNVRPHASCPRLMSSNAVTHLPRPLLSGSPYADAPEPSDAVRYAWLARLCRLLYGRRQCCPDTGFSITPGG